jgi:hypothetical protein
MTNAANARLRANNHSRLWRMGERVSRPTMRLSAARPAPKLPHRLEGKPDRRTADVEHEPTRIMREPRIMSAIQPNGITKDDAPLTPVYGTPIDHPGAWKVADFKTPADYTIELGAIHLRDIERVMRQIKAAGLGLDDLRREHFDFPSLRRSSTRSDTKSKRDAASSCCAACRSRIIQKTRSA